MTRGWKNWACGFPATRCTSGLSEPNLAASPRVRAVSGQSGLSRSVAFLRNLLEFVPEKLKNDIAYQGGRNRNLKIGSRQDV